MDLNDTPEDGGSECMPLLLYSLSLLSLLPWPLINN